MSEMVESGAVETSAPTSSVDIAAQVVETAENESGGEIGDVASDDAPDRVDAEQAEPVVAKPEPVQLSPEDAEIEALLAEFGFKEAKKPDGREHYIPRSKVLKMIGSGLKRGSEKWTTERAVIEQQASEARGFLEKLRAGVSGDPHAFLSELASVDPRYAAFLQQQAEKAAPAVDDRPKPDVDLRNGQWTYSPDGVEKLLAWKASQLLDERLKPIEERSKAEQQRAKDYEDRVAMQARTSEQMQEAQSWPMFGQITPNQPLTSFQNEVLAELRKDSAAAEAESQRLGKHVAPRMTMRQAYLEVYARHQEPDKVRARVLEEIKGAKPAPALSRQSGDSQRQPGPVSTRDIVQRVVAQAESKG
jgi:hypothetical protein